MRRNAAITEHFSAPPVYLKKSTGLFILLATLLCAFGCTLAPTYSRPDLPVPDAYEAEVRLSQDMAAIPASWKDFFQDPVMQQLIETALSNNRDLRKATLAIERTRAQYQIQRSSLLPEIGAGGGYSAQRLPADFSTTGRDMVARQYTAALGLTTFELDLFGRIRSLTEQAYQTYFATEEEANMVRLTLITETASAYLQLVADREQYDLTKATLENRQKSYELNKRKFEAGVSSDLELSQAQSIMDEAAVDLAKSATVLRQGENALALLLGAPIPADLPQARRLADVMPLKDLPEGLPSDLLEYRPDIRAAEHRLMGANASIGAARANFFPRISLTGSYGKMSVELNDLFDGAAKTWSFAPQIYLPIFTGGSNVAQLEVSQATRDMAVAEYEKSIQEAFRDVSDALAQRDNISTLLAAQESLALAAGRTYMHADDRYNVGVAAYINVLDAQRSMFSAQSGLISGKLLRETNTIALYKSLGGSWPRDDAK